MLKGDGRSQGYHYRESHWVLGHLAPNCFNRHHMAKAQSNALKPYPSVFLNIYCCQVANVKQQEGLWDLLLYWAVLEHAQEFVQLLGVSVTEWRKAKQKRVKGVSERKWKKLYLTLSLLTAVCIRYSYCWVNPISPPLPLAKNELGVFRQCSDCSPPFQIVRNVLMENLQRA